MIVPFKVLPVAYVLVCWIMAFVFELGLDLSLVSTFYFSWVYLRLFMQSKNQAVTQIGDGTQGFALSTFVPEKAKPTVDWMCKVTYKFFNLCKLVDGIQACLKSRSVAEAKAKAENRKKALKMLEKEISDKKNDDEEGEGDEEDLEAKAPAKKG